MFEKFFQQLAKRVIDFFNDINFEINSAKKQLRRTFNSLLINNADKAPQPQYDNEVTQYTENIISKLEGKMRKKANLSEIKIPPRTAPKPRVMSACMKYRLPNDYEAYYRNGKLYDVNPRDNTIPLYEDRQTVYDARYIILNGVKYDLENAEDIIQLNEQNYYKIRDMQNTPPVVYDLAYLLKMRAGSEFRPDIAVALAYKAANLMIISPIEYSKDDYYRLVHQLWLIGEIEYGDYLLKELEKRLPSLTDDKYYRKVAFIQEMKMAKKLKLDYIIFGHSSCVCEKCASYQDRAYSISGRDKRFPKLPEFIIEQMGLHCDISFDCVLVYDGQTITRDIYEGDERTPVDFDIVKCSNRPFVDDRSDYEKECYAKTVEQRKTMLKESEYKYSREYWTKLYHQHLEYQQIVDVMGEKAPKSYSGYMRMKKGNTVNYQKIVKIADENNIKIN